MPKRKSPKGLSQLAKTTKTRKTKEILIVKLHDVISKEQVRQRFKGIKELASTLLTEGQQSPIIVSPQNGDGKYVIQKGERRWRACKFAGIKTIDVIVNTKKQSTVDAVAGELIENIQREDLTPIEIANALKTFSDNGWRQTQIAEKIGKSKAFVSSHLTLLKLPECVLALYEKEICADVETLNNLRLLFGLNQPLGMAICSEAQSKGITRLQSRNILNQEKVALKEEVYQSDSLPDDSEEEGEGSVAKNHQITWKKIHPEKVVIRAKTLMDGEEIEGTLMLGRISSGWVWMQPKGDEQPIYVKTSDVELLSVDG